MFSFKFIPKQEEEEEGRGEMDHYPKWITFGEREREKERFEYLRRMMP